MHTKDDLTKALGQAGIHPDDTLLVHSSMKAIGPVDGGADTVLDAFIEYMAAGLLIFPTHTWQQIDDDYPVFRVADEPSCVGLLTNLFMQRPGVIRSWHPTHSVAALGDDAAEYTAGEERWDTPLPRQGCWGRLIDRRAKVLFLGCTFRSNTLLHGVEEWNGIPNRIADTCQQLTIVTPDGRAIPRPMHRHYHPRIDVSQNYGKMEKPFLETGIAHRVRIGDAQSFLCDAAAMAELTASLLRRNPDLFGDHAPVPEEWYRP